MSEKESRNEGAMEKETLGTCDFNVGKPTIDYVGCQHQVKHPREYNCINWRSVAQEPQRGESREEFERDRFGTAGPYKPLSQGPQPAKHPIGCNCAGCEALMPYCPDDTKSQPVSVHAAILEILRQGPCAPPELMGKLEKHFTDVAMKGAINDLLAQQELVFGRDSKLYISQPASERTLTHQHTVAGCAACDLTDTPHEEGKEVPDPRPPLKPASHVAVVTPPWAQEILSNPNATKEEIERAHAATYTVPCEHQPASDAVPDLRQVIIDALTSDEFHRLEREDTRFVYRGVNNSKLVDFIFPKIQSAIHSAVSQALERERREASRRVLEEARGWHKGHICKNSRDCPECERIATLEKEAGK